MIQLSSMYYGIPRSVVETFVGMCDACQRKKSQHNHAPLKPIILNSFFSRLQVNNYYLCANALYACSYIYLLSIVMLLCTYSYLHRLIWLINMRHLPDGQYKWIFHAIDHWSKFSFAFPLENKEAQSVASVIKSFIFPYFGVPKIFQSDNGKEFVNSVIKNLLHSWSSKIQIIHGRPRHPQSQRAVERAHRTLEQKLATQLESDMEWSKFLPHVVCK